MQVAAAVDAIPVVQNATDRAAKFPAPVLNQRVHDISVGQIQRFTAAGWVTDALSATAPALTVNAYTGIGTNESQVTAAIAAAVALGAKYVWVPAILLPYTASLVTFNPAVRVVREGGPTSTYDLAAYGADPSGVADATASAVAAAAGACATSGTLELPAGTFKLTAGFTLTADSVRVVGAGRRIAASGNSGTVLLKAFTGTLITTNGTPAAKRNGLYFKGFTVEGQDVGGGFTGTALDISNTVGTVCEDVECHAVIGRAFNVNSVYDAVFARCWVRNCGDGTNLIPAIDIDSSATDHCDRIDFHQLHSESNKYTHMRLRNSGGGGVPKWVSIVQSKMHDSQTIGSQITVPILDIQAGDIPILSGTRFMYSQGYAVQTAATQGVISGVIIDQVGSIAAPGGLHLVTGAARNHIDVTVRANVAPGTAKIVVDAGAQSNFIRYLVNGSGTNFSDAGTNTIAMVEQDGVVRIDAGKQQTAAVNEATGAGSAALGANCPAVTVGAPYKWIKMTTSDGSAVYCPVWK